MCHCGRESQPELLPPKPDCGSGQPGKGKVSAEISGIGVVLNHKRAAIQSIVDESIVIRDSFLRVVRANTQHYRAELA